jgi:predicted metal-dependent hydrolase
VTAYRSELRTLIWDRREIPYELTFESTRDLVITVHPDLRVTVRAPDSKPLVQIERRLLAKRAWIARQLRELEAFQPAPAQPRFISGETHRYLGRQYRLKVSYGPRSVRCFGGRLIVVVPHPKARGEVERTLHAWYAARARVVFAERITAVRSRVHRLSDLDPVVRVSRMQRRWGSCGPNGTITLNTELVRAPKRCIDYVIIHELCHLVVPTHSSRFYALLSECLPEWKETRARLNASLS